MRVNWVLLDRSQPDGVQVGDLVSADCGGLPLYRVLAAENGRALLRDEQRQCERTSPLSHFRWKACTES